MGIFGRKPRKVGFGLPEQPQSTHTHTWDKPRYGAKPSPASTSEPVKTGSVAKTFAHSKRDSRNSAPQAPADNVTEQQRQMMQQIDKLKKSSPWLAGIVQKMATAQAKGRVGTPNMHIPTPKPVKSRRAMIIIAFILFFMLGPIISAIAMLFAR